MPDVSPLPLDGAQQTFVLFDSTPGVKLPDPYMLELILLYQAGVATADELELYFGIVPDEMFLFFGEPVLGATPFEVQSPSVTWIQTVGLGPDDEEDANVLFMSAKARLHLAYQTGTTYIKTSDRVDADHITASETNNPKVLGLETQEQLEAALDHYDNMLDVRAAFIERAYTTYEMA